MREGGGAPRPRPKALGACMRRQSENPRAQAASILEVHMPQVVAERDPYVTVFLLLLSVHVSVPAWVRSGLSAGPRLQDWPAWLGRCGLPCLWPQKRRFASCRHAQLPCCRHAQLPCCSCMHTPCIKWSWCRPGMANPGGHPSGRPRVCGRCNCVATEPTQVTEEEVSPASQGHEIHGVHDEAQ